MKLYPSQPNLCLSTGDRALRQDRLCAFECREITNILSCLVVYTEGEAAHQRGARVNREEGPGFEWATVVCDSEGGVPTAALMLQLEDIAPATEATLDRVWANFGTEDDTFLWNNPECD